MYFCNVNLSQRVAQILAAALICSSSAMAQDGASAEANMAPEGLAIPQFVEQANEAGVKHQFAGGDNYVVGGGVGTFDCDSNGLADIALSGGENALSVFRNVSEQGGELKFEPVRVDIPAELATKVIGIYPLDLEGDGHDDLILLRRGENVLLKGGENCSFRAANADYGFDGGDAWTTAFSAIWLNEDKFPSLLFGNYIDQDAPGAPFGTCEDNVLVRATGEGENPNFANIQNLQPSYCTLSALFVDWTGNADWGLRLSNDRQYYRGGEEQMYSIARNGDFKMLGREDGWEKLEIWGMGIAPGDVDGDGRAEFALTSMADTKLQTLSIRGSQTQPKYQDIAFERGATAHRPYAGDQTYPSTGWHSQFADFNNDGRPDLFIAKGNVAEMPNFADYDPDNLLLQKADGTFFEAGLLSGIALDRTGRGASVADFNNDGLLDLITVNRNEPVALFKQVGTSDSAANGHITISLRASQTNMRGVGARVEVTGDFGTTSQSFLVGGGHASGTYLPLHFGIGASEAVDVRVIWPNGTSAEIPSVAKGSRLEVSKDIWK